MAESPNGPWQQNPPHTDATTVLGSTVASRSQMPAMSPQLYLLLFRMRFPTTDAQYLRRLHGCQQYPLNSLMSSLFRMHCKRRMHNTTGKCLKAQRASHSIMPRREMLSALLDRRHLTIMPPA